ncbi:MlaD family protein [Nocardia miyunensis]|uniref:MlaD family protein n=1 Tax=Nocardia miyunensis TaxID=282684 RepID=UPI001FE20ECF|nr:MlaD family protein [Nocardia miyunensis]
MSAAVVAIAASSAVGYAASTDGGGSGGGSGFCADMPDAIGLYPGNPVTQMGYKVGKVDSVHPAGDHVRVTFTLDAGRAYPADVKAVTRSKSLLADRSLELVGNYTSGPKLAAGQCVPTSRSFAPKSISQIAGSAADFIDAMSPNDHKKSFQEAVDGFDKAMHGNGELADEMMQHAAQAMQSPNQFVADIGSIIHNMAPMSDEALRKWSTIQSILDQAPAISADGADLWPGTEKLAYGIGFTVATLYMIQRDYGSDLWPLMDGPVTDAIHLAATHSKDLAGLVDSIPSVASVLRQQSQSPGGLAVAYRPPTVQVNAPNAGQMCDVLNQMTAGSCTNAGGRVQVPALRLLDLVVAKGK